MVCFSFKFANTWTVFTLLLTGGDIITTEESFWLLNGLLPECLSGIDVAIGGAILSWYELNEPKINV